MKWNKLIGTSLITSAILLQVGYAGTTTELHQIVNTGKFDIYFHNPIITHSSKYVGVNVQENNNILEVGVSNLYPGAIFDIEAIIQNNGEVDAKVKSIQLTVQPSEDIEETAYNKNLIKTLVGYEGKEESYQGEDAYGKYLTERYTGYIIRRGQSIPLKFSIGMNPDEEGFQNQMVKFQIQIQLEQASVGEAEAGENYSPSAIELSEEPIPGGEIELLEEPIPGGEIELPEEPIPGGEIELPEEAMPGGPLLPQTGGLAPIVVYVIGFTLLAGGIVIYTKKRDEED